MTIRKYSLIAALLLIGSNLFSQESKITYALFNINKAHQATRCFTKNDDFSNINLKLVKGPSFAVKKSVITLTLALNNATQNFSSLDDFKNFNLKNWLINNNAFSQTNTLVFEIESEMIDGSKKYQVLSFCLKATKATRDLNPNTYDKQPDFVKMPIYFATDRNDTKSTDLNHRFGGKRGALQYGMCTVSIPHDHKIGEIERPSIWRLEFSEDPAKHVVLHTVNLLEKDNFFKKLSADIQKSEKKSSFLFVHGYNVSFADAAKRTAQISYDLLFNGEAVFYSWPSRGITADYTIDEANIAWAEANIKNFLNDYLSRTDADEIYLVAHSMGNRGLTKALVSLMTEKPELNKKIKEIILAAPDIDADIFKRDIAPQMVAKTHKPITLYVSSDDVALKASRQVHGSSRAGDSGTDVVLVNGVETIDASGVDTSFLGHSYFASTSSIISDIFDMIKTGKRAEKRKKLQPVTSKKIIYWKVMKNQ